MTASPVSARSPWPACTAPTHPAPRCARSTASTPPPMRWCCTPRISASAAAIASTPARSAHRNIPRSATSARAARWTSAPTVPAAPRWMAAKPSSSNTAPIGWQRASCRSAPRCARPSRSWLATVRSSRRSTRSASPSAATAPAPGAGRWGIARPSRRDGTGVIRSSKFMSRNLLARACGRARSHGDRTMTRLIARIRILIAAAAVLMIAGLAAPASAQQVNPTQEAIKEEQLLRELSKAQGRGSIPDTKSYVIEQPRGREWREFHQVTLKWIGAIAILGMLGLLVVFLVIRGRVRIEGGRSGRTLLRFNAFERLVHWMTATCFIILALSGLNITFGKELLLPYLGPETFATWSQWAKYAHNYLSFPFTLGVVLILLMWIAWNFPTRVDIEWLKAGGGIVGHEHPPARRFNAGQKMIYWVVVLGGGAVAASGYLLMFPFYATDIAGMQAAQSIHGIVSVLFVAAMLGHIYIGTIGMEGAFAAMGTGEVDVNWAKEHHSLWLQQEQARTGPAQ